MRETLLLLVLLIGLFVLLTDVKDDDSRVIKPIPNLTIASWNLQIFGESKASNHTLMKSYASYLNNYDIAIVQEIRSSDIGPFEDLCGHMYGYECKISSRAGRSTSKEQYGVFYRKDITLLDYYDYNPSDSWERPPIRLTFNKSGYVFTLYTIHTKPDDVTNELANLEDVVKNEGNVIIIGDLNADCNYYQVAQHFPTWWWLLDEDTTVSQTDCTYDQVLLNNDAYQEYLSAGVVRGGITSTHSDHYLINLSLQT